VYVGLWLTRDLKKQLQLARIRLCPQAQYFLHKNIKTYLSCKKKGTFGGLAGIALSRGQDIPGH
jgi:hypothetical protein